MPPAKKIQRGDIIRITYEIVRKEGMGDINARRVAKELACSTQPIYHNFDTMEELKNEVIQEIYRTYVSYMTKGAEEVRPYLGMGMAYIRFARDYPNFFKTLFMTESGMSPVDFIQNDDIANHVIREGQLFSGLTREQQKAFHLKVWVFTHGIAALTATNTVTFTEHEIENLLISATKEMLIGFKHIYKQEDE